MTRSLRLPVAFAVATAALLLAGGGALAAPPLAPDAFASWVSERGAATAMLALVRLAALGVAAWLALISTAVAAGRAIGAAQLVRVAERGLPSSMRRAAHGLAGAGLVSAVALGGTAGAQEPAGPAVAGESLVLLPAEGEGTARMSVLPEEPAPAPAPVPPPPAAEWVVEPGDSFWSIAEDLVADDAGGAPAEAAVRAYWQALVEANRDRLVSPDPDLLLPGQVLVLPPVT